MSDLEQDSVPEVQQMRSGSKEALAHVFSLYRERLRRIVRFRLDYRIAGRVSESDVLQETYIAAARRLEHFTLQPEMPAFLWLRLLVGQQLVDVHRRHLQAEKRDARKEVALPTAAPSAQTSVAIAARIAGDIISVSQLVDKAERIEQLERTLNRMDDLDREVIALRHFEELTNAETARVLQIAPAASSKRYVRAMAKLAKMLQATDINGES